MNLASILAFMGLGGQEMIFIFLALLLLFGAKRFLNSPGALGKASKNSKTPPKTFAKVSKTA